MLRIFGAVALAFSTAGGVAMQHQKLVNLHKETLSMPNGPRKWLSERWLDVRLVNLLSSDFDEYGKTASELTGIERSRLPNVENVEWRDELANVTFRENLFEKGLLELTRRRYESRSPVAVSRSENDGILGLLDEMRQVAFSPSATTEDQRDLVVAVLKDLATPPLPPFYRLFVAGVRPKRENGDPQWLVDLMKDVPLLRDDPNTQPPPFYAPFMTSVVAPLVFSYLVGPATLNRRSDGRLGGINVKRCKFLQESGCKGLCLHQCKLPAQQLFNDDFKVPLYVKPNFETLECQWSWGVEAPPPSEDPAWPKGCLDACPTRHLATSSPSWCEQQQVVGAATRSSPS